MKNILKVAEHILIVGIGFVLLWGILSRTGTLTSGYHFLDDHEVVRISYSL